jgi:hypothetical protein
VVQAGGGAVLIAALQVRCIFKRPPRKTRPRATIVSKSRRRGFRSDIMCR